MTQLVRRPGVYHFPADAEPLFGLYRQLYEATDGAVSPLVGRALEHLGYDADYRLSRRPGAVTVPGWDDVMVVSGQEVSTRQPVLLDVGAVGKGFLVDLVAEVLVDAGVGEFVVDASGDLLSCGFSPERVGLESPFNPAQVIGVASVANSALCASTSTRRSWGDGLHHIINPATGEPTTDVIASWVTHPSCAVADGLATALFLTQPTVLSRHFSFDFVRLLADGRAELSLGFDGELFS